MAEDWSAVAKAINARMSDLDLRQKDVAERSGVSVAIIRELSQDRIQRQRNPRTLEALSLALGWHPQHLTAVLNGEDPPLRSASATQTLSQDRVVVLLDAILRELRGLRAQMTALNRRMDHADRRDDVDDSDHR